MHSFGPGPAKAAALPNRKRKNARRGCAGVLVAVAMVAWCLDRAGISAQTPKPVPEARSPRAGSSGQGLLTPPAPPSFQGITHTAWTRRDGAPGSITSLAQTKDGYLWIGSALGLYRFDGLRFASYPFASSSSGLPSLNVCSLAADLDGGLWVAMCNATVVHLKADEGVVTYGRDKGMPSGSLDKIFALPDGSVWIAGSSKLLRLEGDRFVDFGKGHGIGRFGVFSVLFDREENIWIGRDKRLSILRKATGQLEDVPNQVNYVSAMAQSRTGEIWISDAWRAVRPLSDASPEGVLHLQGKAEMLVDRHDNLWIAQDDEGLSRILSLSEHGKPWIVEQAGKNDLSAPQTRALLEDSEGNIWVGTERGLDRFRETPFIHFRSTELRYFPSLIAGDDGSVWINSHGSSLMKVLDGVTTPFGKHVNSGPFVKRRNGDVCFIDLTSYELQCYGRGKETHAKLGNNLLHNTPPLSVVEDTDGSLLISFQGGGFWRYGDERWDRVTAPGSPASSVWSMLSDSEGRLWLGYGNRDIVRRQQGTYSTLHVDEGVWSNTLTFFQTPETVWAAGSNGLAFLDGDRFRRVYSSESNLLQGTSGITRDQFGNLWLNAGTGVLRISSEEVTLLLRNPRHLVKIDLFDENDGLVGQPTQFKRGPSAIADAHGLLWFAMAGDVVSLDPSRLGQGGTLPNVLIESVLIDGWSALRAPGRPGAVLRAEATRLHDLEINFVGINLSAPERVYYRYRLIGENPEWQDVGRRRQAFYTRLNPGSYQFQVSASSGEDWSDLTVPLRIEVSPAFYQTAWFMALCLMSAVGLVWLAFRARVRFVTEQVHSRLSERLAERERVARELHDTLLQGFQGLMMRFHLAAQTIPSTETAKSEMEEALDSADMLLAESRDRIRDLRYDTLEATSLADAITALGEGFGMPHIWTLQVLTHGVALDLDPISYQEIYAIAKEAVVNAFRHSEASEIRVDISFEQARLQLDISDNGKGIAAERLSVKRRMNHWGLAGMHERAKNLGADLRFMTPIGGGTQVKLAVPAAVAFRRNQKVSAFQSWRRKWSNRAGRTA
jgi:signal transduction histidine kinase/ligand-binding sensor domain-containing protein